MSLPINLQIYAFSFNFENFFQTCLSIFFAKRNCERKLFNFFRKIRTASQVWLSNVCIFRRKSLKLQIVIIINKYPHQRLCLAIATTAVFRSTTPRNSATIAGRKTRPPLPRPPASRQLSSRRERLLLRRQSLRRHLSHPHPCRRTCRPRPLSPTSNRCPTLPHRPSDNRRQFLLWGNRISPRKKEASTPQSSRL